MEPKLCFIRKSYFKKNASFIKMLDTGNADKQSKRTHLCVMVETDGNNFYIPLRNNLGAELRKFGRIGHAVPSERRKNAGLDYRYALIVNDELYIEHQAQKKIPKSQYRRIKNDYESIKTEFEAYLHGFIRAVKKKRNLTQRALADKLHMNVRTIIEAEQGHSNPKFETVALLAGELNISLDAIVFPDSAAAPVSKSVVDFFSGKSEMEIQKYITLCQHADTLKNEL